MSCHEQVPARTGEPSTSSHISPANLGAGRCTTRPPSAPLAEAVPISSDAKKYNDHAGFEASDPAGLCQYGMKRDGEPWGGMRLTSRFTATSSPHQTSKSPSMVVGRTAGFVSSSRSYRISNYSGDEAMNKPLPVNPPELRSTFVAASSMPWQRTVFDGIEMKILYQDDEGR